MATGTRVAPPARIIYFKKKGDTDHTRGAEPHAGRSFCNPSKLGGDWGAMDQKHEEGDWFVLYQKPTRSCIHHHCEEEKM